MILSNSEKEENLYQKRSKTDRNIGGSDTICKGFWQDLSIKVGLAFTTEGGTDDNIVSTDDGIFTWDNKTIEKVSNTNFHCADLKTKQWHMVGYLCKLIYDWCIPPAKNASDSPGYETPLGIFLEVGRPECTLVSI